VRRNDRHRRLLRARNERAAAAADERDKFTSFHGEP
jgi:hypothetical protein